MLQMARVVSHIQQNFQSQVSVAELAKLAHLSASQFQRRFRQIYNTSPIQYVTNVRIHAASEMLKDPNRGIADIARAAGFSTSAFFCETFKRHIGETPTAYRRRFVQISAADSQA
jgi:transcriptional regulator GlxA family with amidase domain